MPESIIPVTAPMPGHALRQEGRLADADGRFASYGYYRSGHGVCECGWLSERVTSKAAAKRAHRLHKGEVRGATR